MTKGEQLQQWFVNCQDVSFVHLTEGRMNENDDDIICIYCNGMIDEQLLRIKMPAISEGPERIAKPLHNIDEALATELVFTGQLLIYVVTTEMFYVMSIAKPPVRTPEESNTEASILGPKDGFVEDIIVNTALIRKRMLSNTLCYEQYEIGTRSRTKIGLLFIKDIAREEIISLARDRLKSIQIDSLVSSTQLEAFISDRPSSLFPLLDLTGRPDFVVDSLLRGRFAVIVDGSPSVIIAPANFAVLLKSAEDAHAPSGYVTAERIIRLTAFLTSIFLIGFWVALLNFHPTQLPFSLLATIVVSRHGIPLTIPFEAFFITLLFEVLREAGARLPKAVGQTLAVVGGLIIGDSAIKAGLSSPSLIVVAAISTISTFVLVNQTLSSNITILRLFVLFFSSFLGLYGFMFATLLLLIYVAGLRSFGIPYLSPLAPVGSVSYRETLRALIKVPWRQQYSDKQSMYANSNTTQKGEEEG
ncbi:spore germination protein [Paenibacillus yanchengensis]|uniref:Spore germination protein n=1 Tax=Paenibacillus yanchengensis TaxID=2035833 RepID=A0ABW4YGE9_9BACL